MQGYYIKINISNFIFKCNQQGATLYNSFISAKRSTCCRRLLRPSSGAQKLCIQHLVFVKLLLLISLRSCSSFSTIAKVKRNSSTNTRCCMYSFWAPDDGRRIHLKHVEHYAERNELYNVASCWLHLKIHYWCTDLRTSKKLNKFLCYGRQLPYLSILNK
jgi:hypothetical protein